MSLCVRRAAIQDYSGLCALFEEVDTLHRRAHPGLFRKQRGPARDRQYLAALLAEATVAIFVAELEGQVVGLVHLLIEDAPDIPIFVPRRYAVIDDLVVRQDLAGAGIGRALMERAGDWARDRGASSMELNVFEFNQAARAFYERLGYHTVSRRMSKAL